MQKLNCAGLSDTALSSTTDLSRIYKRCIGGPFHDQQLLVDRFHSKTLVFTAKHYPPGFYETLEKHNGGHLYWKEISHIQQEKIAC